MNLDDAMTKCPLCGEGKVVLHAELVAENQPEAGRLFFKICDTCGSEYAGKSECELTRLSRKGLCE